MKNLKYLLILGLLFTALGCDDEQLPEAFLDATWVTNIRPSEDYIVKAGEAVSFRDLSQGALSHEFTIEEGNNYLISGYTNNDSLPLWIDSNKGLVTTDKDAHVLFNNQGINRVTIRNTFKDSVTYQGVVPIPAFQENGVWVVENTWEVDVYATLKPAFKVLDKNDVELLNISGTDREDLILDGSFDPDLIDTSSWPVIDIEAGDELKYIDLTTEDRPNARSWNLVKAKAASLEDSIVNAGYFSLGTFPAGLLRSVREGDLPGERVSKIIPLLVNVIPSSQPFEYNASGGMSENADETITFGVTGEIVPFTGEEGNFTVNVKNIEAGFDENISVSLANVNSEDATKINLKLSAPIFNTDIITVSYSGGAIESVDTRSLNDFGPIEVSMNPGINLYATANLESYASIENASTNRWGARIAGGWMGRPANAHTGDRNQPDDDNYFFMRGTASADAYPVSDGDASLRYKSTAAGITANKFVQLTNFKNMDLPAGKYKFKMDVYMSTGNTMSNITTWFKGPNVVADWDVSPTTVTRDQFVTIENIVDFAASPTSDRMDIRIYPADNPDAGSSLQECYIDNLAIFELEKRN